MLESSSSGRSLHKRLSSFVVFLPRSRFGGKAVVILIHERTLGVIQAFYDAALDETLWRTALESLCDLTGSQAASFWVLDGSGQPRLPTFICINFDMESIREYLDHT